MIFVEIDFRKSLHERKLVEYRILPATNKQDNVQYMYRTRSCKRYMYRNLSRASADRPEKASISRAEMLAFIGGALARKITVIRKKINYYFFTF